MQTLKTVLSAAALAASSFFASGLASAGCDLNVTFRNTGAGQIQIDLRNSQSKVKGGWWLNMKGRFQNVDDDIDYLYVDPGDNLALVLKSDFGCNDKRRFRIANACGEWVRGAFSSVDEKEKDWPSSDGWHEGKNINIEFDRCKADY
jgi:hypothetical protein